MCLEYICSCFRHQHPLGKSWAALSLPTSRPPNFLQQSLLFKLKRHIPVDYSSLLEIFKGTYDCLHQISFVSSPAKDQVLNMVK